MSSDGGRSWQRTDPGIRSIVRLKTYSDRSVFAIGTDANCRPTYAWTTAPGQPWRRERGRAADSWYRVPDDRDTVHAPGGQQTKPCGSKLADLAGVGTYRAAALCTDGRVRTIAQGRGWRTVRTDPGVLAISANDKDFVAGVAAKGCSGADIRLFGPDGAGLRSTALTCLKDAGTTRSFAVSAVDRAAWLWHGDEVEVSGVR